MDYVIILANYISETREEYVHPAFLNFKLVYITE